MHKFIITYTEGDTINKKIILSAETKDKATVKFCMLYPLCDIESVEEVTE